MDILLIRKDWRQSYVLKNFDQEVDKAWLSSFEYDQDKVLKVFLAMWWWNIEEYKVIYLDNIDYKFPWDISLLQKIDKNRIKKV